MEVVLTTPVPDGAAQVLLALAAGAVTDVAANGLVAVLHCCTIITNNVSTADTTPPVFLHAATSTDGSSVTLYFNEPLGTADHTKISVLTGMPPSSVAVSSASVTTRSTKQVEVVLSTPITEDAVVTLTLAEGAVTDLAGNSVAAASNLAVTNLVEIFAVVTKVEITSDPNDDGREGDDDTYKYEDIIEVTVTFSLPVDVVDTLAGPTLWIEIPNQQGAPSRVGANYNRGSGTTSLVFSASVPEEREELDGLSIAENALDFNGGIIRRVDKPDSWAVLDHAAVPPDPKHQVDSTFPDFTSAETSTDGDRIILTMDEDISSVTYTPETFGLWSGDIAYPPLDLTDLTADLSIPVTGATVSGARTVELSLQSSITAGATVFLSLSAESIFDLVGNGNEFDIWPVTNNAAPAEWRLAVTGGAGTDAAGDWVIEEGGDPIGVVATITNGVTFATDQTVTLEWGGTPVGGTEYPGSLLFATSVSATSITVAAGEPGGAVVLTPRDDAYFSRAFTRELEGKHGEASVGTANLAYRDDEPPPAVTVAAQRTTVTEGESITLTATLTHGTTIPFVNVTWTGTEVFGGITQPGSQFYIDDTAQTESSLTLTTDDDTDPEETATVVFRLESYTEDPGYEEGDALRWTLGTPSSVTVTVLDNDSPPGRPGNLVASPGDGEVTLRWTAPANHLVDSYEVQWRQTGAGSFNAWRNVGDVMSYTVESLTNEVQYTFRVRAKNAIGTSPAASATATPGVVGVEFRVTSGDGEVTLQWAAPKSDGGRPILRYEYRLRSQRDPWVEIPDSAPGGANDGTYTIGGRENGKPVIVYLRAVTTTGAGPSSPAHTAVPQAGAPGVPGNFRAEKVSDTEIRLSWTKPSVGPGR